ncbi:MAG: hypothetical protein R3E96_12250 [Planctomycetota bacterium]
MSLSRLSYSSLAFSILALTAHAQTATQAPEAIQGTGSFRRSGRGRIRAGCDLDLDRAL